MKSIIAGSRSFNNYEFMKNSLEPFIDTITTVISGTAKGADTLGELWASEYHKDVIRMPANWEVYGRSAGYRRNEDMAKNADICFVFWDGSSKGSKHMIDIARSSNIELHIFKY